MTKQARALATRVQRRLLAEAGRRRAMQFPPLTADLHKELTYDSDYTRLAAFSLALRRLDQENIGGAIVELGVFRGDASVLLQRSAPRRHLHLFDTFQGFPREQLDIPGDDSRFDQTSVEAVRARLPANALVTFHPGLVPDSLSEVSDERFAFILLDLDLSAPTRSALEFLWPRMTPGSFLFVHDYNNPESNWAMQRALTDFLADKPERLIELPDVWGSVVLRREIRQRSS